MDCEVISGAGPKGRAPEMVTTLRKPQSSVESTNVVMPITPFQQQAPPMIDLKGEDVALAGHSLTQNVLNFIAHKYFQDVDPSKPEELNGFLQYLKDKHSVRFVDTQQGGLIITLECSSLKRLKGLWEDYSSGRLNEMAQKFLVTEDVLR